MGRPSALGSEIGSVTKADQSMNMLEDRSQVSDTEFPLQEEEEETGIPFEESPDGRGADMGPGGGTGDGDGDGADSLLSPGATPADVDGNGKRKSLAIDGLELDLSTSVIDQASPSSSSSPKRKARARVQRDGPKRSLKRRRIDIDNDGSELSTSFIKEMLRDTSDIVQQNRVHPADYIEEAENGNGNGNDENNPNSNMPSYLIPRRRRMKHLISAKRIASLPYERLLARPNCADDGGVAPEILQVWEWNAARVMGKPFPYKMRGKAGEEQRRQRAEEMMKSAAAKEAQDEEDAEADDIEIGRQQDDKSLGGNEGRLSMDIAEQDDSMEEDGAEAEFPQHEDEEFPLPFDQEEEEEEVPFPNDEDETNAQFANDMPGMESPDKSEESQRSEFSLGAVNDLEAELADEPRQGQGDDLASSATKWHAHTVKVLGMLKRNMDADTNENEDSDIDSDGKEKGLSYDKLSYGTSRRTACGVFFELLQLKTWDFIELGQETSYGDIKITPGTRFAEGPPSE